METEWRESVIYVANSLKDDGIKDTVYRQFTNLAVFTMASSQKFLPVV